MVSKTFFLSLQEMAKVHNIQQSIFLQNRLYITLLISKGQNFVHGCDVQKYWLILYSFHSIYLK